MCAGDNLTGTPVMQNMPIMTINPIVGVREVSREVGVVAPCYNRHNVYRCTPMWGVCCINATLRSDYDDYEAGRQGGSREVFGTPSLEVTLYGGWGYNEYRGKQGAGS
jgi:hypothetical protein